MTSTTDEEQLLAADARGRVLVTPQRREALLGEFDKSGLSAPRFARLAGIKYSTFAGWRSRRRKAGVAAAATVNVETPEPAVERPARVRAAATSPIRLLEAALECPPTKTLPQHSPLAGAGLRVERVAPEGEPHRHRPEPPPGLILELPGGARIVMASPLQLRLGAELIAMLSPNARLPC